MNDFKMLVEIAGVVGLAIVIVQCIKIKWKIPGPFYPLVLLAITVPLNLLNVYLVVWLPPRALFAVQGAVVAVLIATGIVSTGKKIFEKQTMSNGNQVDKL